MSAHIHNTTIHLQAYLDKLDGRLQHGYDAVVHAVVGRRHHWRWCVKGWQEDRPACSWDVRGLLNRPTAGDVQNDVVDIGQHRFGSQARLLELIYKT